MFRAYTLFDKREQEEYRVFCELKEFASTRKLNDSFERTVQKVNGLFEDTIIQRHSKRMNGPDNYTAFISKQDFEREHVRLHELTEILFLKWDCGRDFDAPIGNSFWHSHLQAIRIENLFSLSKAQAQNIPLTQKALEYIRFYDERSLHAIFRRKMDDIPDSVKTLTKNKECLPTIEEIKNYLSFLEKNFSFETEQIKEMVWSRYIFTKLHEKYTPQNENYLYAILIFLFIITAEDAQENIAPHKIEEALDNALSTLNSTDLERYSSNFDDFQQMIILDKITPFHLQPIKEQILKQISSITER